MAKAADSAGLDGVTFHALRHTFASILIAQGRDPVFVSRQLGHTNAAITLRVYAHLFDAERHAREAREGLESEYGAFFDQGSSTHPSDVHAAPSLGYGEPTCTGES